MLERDTKIWYILGYITETEGKAPLKKTASKGRQEATPKRAKCRE